MKLVVDANIIISGIISGSGKTAELIFNDKLELSAPEFLYGEISKHKQEILKKSGLSEADFDLAISLIFSKIKFIEFSEFKGFIKRAKDVCPDPNDIEYFALALKLGIPIWSDDKKLKEQEKIKTIFTTEMIRIIENED